MGTAEVESALVAHPKVSEAAVVGYPHDIKGQGIYAYVTLMTGEQPSEELRKELVAWVRKEIGPIASPDLIQFAPGLPKTRSGKIMRRILRKIAEDEFGNLGDTSTLADPAVVDDLVEQPAEQERRGSLEGAPQEGAYAIASRQLRRRDVPCDVRPCASSFCRRDRKSRSGLRRTRQDHLQFGALLPIACGPMQHARRRRHLRQGAGFLHAGVAAGVRLQRQNLPQRVRSPSRQGGNRHQRRLQEAARGRRRAGREIGCQKEEAGEGDEEDQAELVRSKGELEEAGKSPRRRSVSAMQAAWLARSRHCQGGNRPAEKFPNECCFRIIYFNANISSCSVRRPADRRSVETPWLRHAVKNAWVNQFFDEPPARGVGGSEVENMMSLRIAVALAATIGAGLLITTDAQARPELVGFPGNYSPGTIVVKTNERRLYLVLDPGHAVRYPVGVGKAGKQWAGVTRIEGKYRNPAWSPPADVKHDKPSIPDVIPGGSPRNPMGVAAMTLEGGEYAIHGTNVPNSVGGFRFLRLHPHGSTTTISDRPLESGRVFVSATSVVVTALITALVRLKVREAKDRPDAQCASEI